ncbi:hypothetical protein PARHAE_01107 [Paracoccus haematequi]|uniref:Uncharacterized protein n=1 Tax=Paracoccus haematequi TaxID=2491866 RepID=A0A3S4CHH5_9RHOB|nr:helix-turn-helix transcriptional regulator [Paracoccus haematequi]VDS07927.1 hypothetical protein PARHAE_01107 [Paracoccus haematequi]
MIDDKWFKAQQRKVGVTTEDIARRMGRDRTAVSHIYTGRQKMSLAWAKAFASVLKVPIDEVLRRAGVADDQTIDMLVPGFAEGDVHPWQGFSEVGSNRSRSMNMADQLAAAAKEVVDNRPGIDIWRVSTGAMIAEGYLPGDFILVDGHAAASAAAGDVVLAQVYENSRGSATTIMRRYEPPVLITASAQPGERRVHVVDGANVVIVGRVIASWRAT